MITNLRNTRSPCTPPSSCPLVPPLIWYIVCGNERKTSEGKAISRLSPPNCTVLHRVRFSVLDYTRGILHVASFWLDTLTEHGFVLGLVLNRHDLCPMRLQDGFLLSDCLRVLCDCFRSLESIGLVHRLA